MIRGRLTFACVLQELSRLSPEVREALLSQYATPVSSAAAHFPATSVEASTGSVATDPTALDSSAATGGPASDQNAALRSPDIDLSPNKAFSSEELEEHVRSLWLLLASTSVNASLPTR